jgi:hypothetical protein
MSSQRRGPGRAVPRTVVWTGVVALLALSVAVALLVRSATDRVRSGAGDVAPFDQVYRFDADGALPLQGRGEVPVAPGSVVARWYTFRGWDVVLHEGLDLKRSGPLCLGTSVLDATSHQLEHLTHAPSTAGACD